MSSQEEMFALMMKSMAPMFAQYLKNNSHAVATAAPALLTPKKEPGASMPKKRRSPKSPSRKASPKNKKASKKKRNPSPKAVQSDRTRLGDKLLPMVDKHIRNECPKMLFFIPDGYGKHNFDEKQFKPFVHTAVRLALGDLVGHERFDQALKLCKSIVKNRRYYVSKDPSIPIKTFESEEERNTARAELQRQIAELRGEVKKPSEEKVETALLSESEDDADAVHQINVDELFEDSQRELEDDNKMCPELEDLDFEEPVEEKYFACVALGCDKILSTHECYPVINRGTNDVTWCQEHWGQQQRQLKALEAFKLKKRKILKEGLKAKLNEKAATAAAKNKKKSEDRD